MLNTIEKRLLESYQKIYDENGQPEGMFNVRPGIPFVGNNYLDKKTPNVLSYASAENLSYAYQSHLGTLQPKKVLLHRYKEKQFYRSRYFYDNYKDNDFPHVHIEPFNNGSQLLVTRHILTKLGFESVFNNTPNDFIEQISAANTGKFSIKKATNTDYAQDTTRMKLSKAYIKEDLINLKPDIIILPKTIYHTVNRFMKWRVLLNEAEINKIKFIQIYQLSGWNTHRMRKALNNKENSTELNKANHDYTDWLYKIKDANVKTLTHTYLTWVENELYNPKTIP